MDRATKLLSWLSGLFLVLMIVLIFKDMVIISIKSFEWSFLTDSPFSAGRKGGILPIIISTLLILMISISIVIPIGLGCALFLSEYEKEHPKTTRIIRKAIEILSGVPSIVFGLFGNALFCVYLGLGFSILSGGLTLSMMSLPLFIKTVEEGIRSLPTNYRMVSKSLGLSRVTTTFSIIIPFAIPSIMVGITLSIGRSLAETAALIFTSGYVDRMPESLLDSGRSLSIHIYDLTMNVPGGNINAYKSATVLLILILTTNGFFNLILKSWYKKRIAL